MGFWDEYPEVLKDLQKVEKLINRYVTSRNSLLAKVVAEQFTAGGKRLRPAFVLISSKFGKGRRKNVEILAGAIEILHTATLVHDDVIDCSRLRRGRETVCARYGTDMALYTGDYLFTKAVLMLSGILPADRLDLLARAIKTVCEGEVDQYRDRRNLNTGVITYIKRISRKTAVLFGAACSLGAYAGKCSPETTRALAKYGFSYGIAFQIKDDLKDFLSNSSEEGKPVGNDLMEGVVTLPVILTINSHPEIKNTIEKFLEGERTREDAAVIAEAVRQSGGFRKAEELLEKYIKRGVESLEKLSDNRYRAILFELINKLRL